MKSKLLGLIAVALMTGPLAAQADSIAGEWSGFGVPIVVGPTGNGADENADLVISSPESNGNFSGTLDVTCVGYTAAQCGTGGVVDISGSLSPSGTLDFGPAENPGLFAGTYSGRDTFSGDATSLDGDVYAVTFNRVAVPEPGTLSLLGLGLVGIGLMRRRKAS